MKSEQSNHRMQAVALLVGGGGILLLALLVMLYMTPQGFRPATPVKGVSTGISAGSLTIEGCITKKGGKSIVVLTFRNKSVGRIKDLRITKALLGHQIVQNHATPITIKSLPGRGVQKVTLEFSQVSSHHLDLEVEYLGGSIFSTGSGSISCGLELPLCNVHSTTP